MTGGAAALRNYLGHTVTGMSYLARSMQLTLHLQSPAAAAAAQHAAEEAAAAEEATATWQVHQVRHVPRQTPAGLSMFCLPSSPRCNLSDNSSLVTLGACRQSTGGCSNSEL
jgi:hypothetical protein